MNSRYLLYKDYESGLNNNLMCLELAIGLAYLTQRTLVFYGSIGEEKNIRPVYGGHYFHVPESHQGVVDNQRFPTLFDLLESIPVPHLNYSQFLDQYKSQKLSLYNSSIRLVNAVFAPKSIALNSQFLLEFAEGRKILQDVEEDILHFSECNLGYYSRFFYLPSLGLYQLMNQIKFKKNYTDLANKICQALGRFNGIHVRLTDYRHEIFASDLDYGKDILQTLQSLFPPEDLLVICTDESENQDLFKPIISEYKNFIFLDQFIIHEFKEDFKNLPFTDEQTLGLICNLVMWQSQGFAGTLRSTYTGIIHRNWAKKQLRQNPTLKSLNFHFISRGFPEETVLFKKGVYLENQDGLWSWNRLQWPIPSESKSWYREWPESLLMIF